MSVKLAIFSYPKMKDEMEAIWNEYKSKATIQVVEGPLGEVLAQAKKLEREGAFDVYISAGANAVLLRQNVSTPVVSIRVTGFDLLRSIQHAQKYDGKIAVVNYKKNIPELQEIQEVLKVSITQAIYTSERDLLKKLNTLKTAGVKTIIGHSNACDVAEKIGLQSVLVYTREAMRQALESAYELATSMRHELEKAGRLKAILDYTYSGIIATDSQGKITVFNKEAEKIVGIRAKNALHQPIETIIPNTKINNVIKTGQPELNQLQKIGSSYIFTNRVPICAHNELVGVVATFQDVTTIQKAEGQIRKNLHDKGLVAKFSFDDILGKSPALMETVALAKIFALTESTVMITGETGTGKELLAQSIHNHSPRRTKPFVAVNCSALPETLLESELFGYEDGAFTGARRGGKTGLFELAHTGTIFLDEIGEISPSLQARLLRVLQEKEIMRVGCDRIIPVDARVITATNNDIWQAVQDRKMREDLYYRLNVLHIKLPPLRHRQGDISLLAWHYIKKFAPDMLEDYQQCFSEIACALESYSWPGNIRELRNVMERLTVLAKASGSCLRQPQKYLQEMLPYRTAPLDTVREISDGRQYVRSSCAGISPEDILRVLEEAKGNKVEAARRLGMSRMTLWRRLNSLSRSSQAEK
ncbi:MAG: sigma 54-interacting transcriptional regulator [Negativicutes bacterium]|nr:sigma 54-interacting transcriptional regulator [Negativicutes bacterium]